MSPQLPLLPGTVVDRFCGYLHSTRSFVHGSINRLTTVSDNVLKESTPEAIRAAVQSSLDNLGFKPDSFLIHNPFVIESGKLGAAWQVLESLVEDGTLAGTSLGVSNFRTQDLEEILAVAKIKPVINRECRHCAPRPG